MIKITRRFIKYITKAVVQIYGMVEVQIYFAVKALEVYAKK
jgi:hypothetical protein